MVTLLFLLSLLSGGVLAENEIAGVLSMWSLVFIIFAVFILSLACGYTFWWFLVRPDRRNQL